MTPAAARADLKSILDYDHETAAWRWRVDRNRFVKAGRSAGGKRRPGGARSIIIDGTRYPTGILAAFYMTGYCDELPGYNPVCYVNGEWRARIRLPGQKKLTEIGRFKIPEHAYVAFAEAVQSA